MQSLTQPSNKSLIQAYTLTFMLIRRPFFIFSLILSFIPTPIRSLIQKSTLISTLILTLIRFLKLS